MKLTKTAIDDLKSPPGKDDYIAFFTKMPGFGVRIQKGGSKTFVVQWKIGDKSGRISLGNVNKIGLEEATRQARAIFEQAAAGINPSNVRKEQKAKAAQAIVPLFKRYLEAKKSGWSDSYYSEVDRSLMTYFAPLHKYALTEITRTIVSDELAAIQEERGDTTRNRARSHLSAFFNWAIGEGLCENNPVEKTNKAPETPRDRALTDAELRAVWNSLDADVFSDDERDLVRLMILTLQREKQIGDLRVREISDGGKRLAWERKRAKNKGFSKHVMPIGPLAQAILARRNLEGREFVFGRWDTGFANYTHLKSKIDEIVKLNEGWWFHDFRRTGKTAMSEHLDVIHEVSEAIINHGKKDMDKVYNNAQYLRQKLDAITKWESYVMAALRGETPVALAA